MTDKTTLTGLYAAGDFMNLLMATKSELAVSMQERDRAAARLNAAKNDALAVLVLEPSAKANIVAQTEPLPHYTVEYQEDSDNAESIKRMLQSRYWSHSTSFVSTSRNELLPAEIKALETISGKPVAELAVPAKPVRLAPTNKPARGGFNL